ncbi:hypothetical protein HDU96_001190 [Phlyctochytrium bullatum]|nr:hypothetical protein HDU96_001190 [Phlyctochytrium bullatum]
MLVSKINLEVATKLDELSDIPPSVMAELAVACSPTVKVCDFGFASVLSSPVREVYAYGTPAYWPPEIQLNRLRPNHPQSTSPFAADMFALGLTLICLLQGWEKMPDAVHLANGRNPGVTYQDLQAERYPYRIFRTDLGPDGEDLLAGLLTTRPDRRLTAFQVLEHPWVKEILLAAGSKQADGKPVFGEAANASANKFEVFVDDLLARHGASVRVPTTSATQGAITQVRKRAKPRKNRRRTGAQQQQRQCASPQVSSAAITVGPPEAPPKGSNDAMDIDEDIGRDRAVAFGMQTPPRSPQELSSDRTPRSRARALGKGKDLVALHLEAVKARARRAPWRSRRQPKCTEGLGGRQQWAEAAPACVNVDRRDRNARECVPAWAKQSDQVAPRLHALKARRAPCQPHRKLIGTELNVGRGRGVAISRRNGITLPTPPGSEDSVRGDEISDIDNDVFVDAQEEWVLPAEAAPAPAPPQNRARPSLWNGLARVVASIAQHTFAALVGRVVGASC